MRRPLPPELRALGDHLEIATRRAVGRRQVRRQLVLNALASVAVAVPLVGATVQTATVAAPPAEAPAAPARPSYGNKGFDSPPRLLRRVANPNGDVLYEETTLRRALR